MIRSTMSNDMINIRLRQMGALSIKTSPAHINIAKFEIAENLRICYMYEVKEEEIYLQRISPYPLMIGKIYNEQQVVDLVEMDLKKFQAAYQSSCFPQFMKLTSSVVTFNKEIENLFMMHNVPAEKLNKLEEQIEKLHEMILETAKDSPSLD